MKFTLNWLKKYLTTSESVESLSEKLSSIGLEVENIEDKSSLYKNFVVAQIDSAETHPNANKLKVCSVNDGTQILQVVCGAPNARAGIKVVLAKVGAIVPKNQLIIKKSEIRSVESNGMLCSTDELMLAVDNPIDGILELSADATVGQSYGEYAGFNDVVFEIAITPNRGDCTNVYGIARDLSASGAGTLKNIKAPSLHINQISPHKVTIEDSEGCIEFATRYIQSVSNDIPYENKLLNAIGISHKSAIVDISNFMMLSLGRPNHMYDADKIEGDIVVRKSIEGEKFIALGSQEYILPADLTVISDASKVLAIAGVIGGELSKVDKDTRNILIEVANFDDKAIMRAGRALGILTDSRFRFERKVDGGNTALFMDCITAEILSHCGGEISEMLVTKGKNCNYIKSIYFDYEKVLKIIGFSISREHCLEILKKLGFIVQQDGMVVIPSWRYRNIEITEDLAEEIIRIAGMENVPALSLPQLADYDFNMLVNNNVLKTKEHCKSVLRARAFSEVITWSFISEKLCQSFDFQDLLVLDNPLSVDFAVMRPTILIGIMSAIQKNIARDFNSLSLFEIGQIYSSKVPTNLEELAIAGLRYGVASPKSIHGGARNYDFYDIKDDIFAALQALGVYFKNISLSRNTPPYYHTTKSAKLTLGNRLLGYCGELHPKIRQKFDIKAPVLGFEIFYNNIPDIKNKPPVVKLSEYQIVSRDFAFLVQNNVMAADLIQSIEKLGNPLITSVEIFDLYEGNELPENTKSIALNVKLQSYEKTLIDSEIEEVCAQIIKNICDRTAASIRV